MKTDAKSEDGPTGTGTGGEAPPVRERVLRGHGVSPGIAIGPAHVVDAGRLPVPEYAIPAAAVDQERARFAEAVTKGRRQLKKLKTKAGQLPEAAAEEIGFLLDAHMAMLSDSRLVRGVDRRIATDLINAEAAVQAEIASIVKTFQTMDDPYLAARMADVREVGNRLIRNLLKHPFKAFSALPEGTVILAEELTPADTALLDPRIIRGFAAVLGGAEGHTAIMARSLNLPAALGVAGLLQGVQPGGMVVVDGVSGHVVLNATDATVAAYRERQEELARERQALRRLVKLPAVSRDGVEVTLQANLELPRDVDAAARHGAQGIGLLRTEFMFMNRSDIPDEEEQYRILRDVVMGMGGRPVTARTLDVGGEKLAAALEGAYPEPANPALSLRAIRLGLREPWLLEAQLAAMVRAAAHGPLRILLPMICNVSEVQRVREMLATVMRRLKRRNGVRLPETPPPLGIMIEIPGAALAADALARVSDFFAIGTNDLTQYTLAIDRADEQVAALYDPLHPAVLRLIQFSCEAALRARIPVSVCGEIAGDPRFTALLLGLGVRDLSMSPSRIGEVKRRLRNMDVLEATRRARVIMDQSDSGRIAALLDDFNGLA
ncbi:MAG TPA: phosphoenolpyruvate--protein phosphotransferase [Azospirillaceae bacterium]|nr:phosphoenolpyruvate--protein phosphotransferase [Azospirillaceae bacterium]